MVFELSAEGPIVEIEPGLGEMVRVTNAYPDHTLSIEVEGLEPIEVSAKWGSVLAGLAERALEAQGEALSVCGSCKYFLQTNLAAEWSNGFSGYCLKAGDDKLDTVVDILGHCDQWCTKVSS